MRGTHFCPFLWAQSADAETLRRVLTYVHSGGDINCITAVELDLNRLKQRKAAGIGAIGELVRLFNMAAVGEPTYSCCQITYRTLN